ncbi:beta-glucosidase [Sphingomonas morindae]|uniref:Glycoside hydrolase family 3 C-terminal domain-containing protein n=1 Tax=Sphingomonas morindae TaxID=1541170 RepID=A0ABY4X8N0_9SPHN|nr:glycoside hydrolase family 3 C-terminal domain-containing protein [Sphingomonas morindae]USI73234.1 glycoside hydrolase family 3 C-terminal domain-containing protein [Sphingomonas morindae]
MRIRRTIKLMLATAAMGTVVPAGAAPRRAPAAAPATPVAGPWQNHGLPAEQRAALLLAAMTQAEKLRLVTGWFGTDDGQGGFKADPLARYGSAGFVPGVPRLGIPPQWQTDAGVGVATQNAVREKPLPRTALASGIALAASWNPALAYAGGAMIGAEARASGFNEMLAGGVDLMRDPRNGRTFEYGGEDPLLAGTVIGAAVRGIESNHIISTVKHYAINDQETGRGILNSVIDRDAARMSDLLAFEIALERSDAGSIMCAYNHVNGDYSCENDWLLNRVLKGDWGWKGFVMSDWGATHSTVQAANAGLDQETGYHKTSEIYFGDKLAAAIRGGQVPAARLDDMARRILWAMFAKGVMDDPVALAPIDFEAHAKVAEAAAREGIVLLRNAGDVLPLAASARRIAVIGGHADAGVLSGGGSAQVYPQGGNAVPGLTPTSWPGPIVYLPSSPMKALAARAPQATVRFDAGTDPAAAAALARDSDVAIVFVTQWMAESQDYPVALDAGQDALVQAVAAANPRTVVVLETGGPVLMPWADRTAAIVEAWYPGTHGGEAIADVLVGAANPSGRLPVSFLASTDQLPRRTLDGVGLPANQMFDVQYPEGAQVGYRWFDAKGLTPAFPFGHGLSYTRFRYSGLSAAPAADGNVTVRFTVTNSGARAGMDVPQVYVSPPAGAGWEAPRRLGAFAKVALRPGESRTLSVRVDPRLLATFAEGRGWSRPAGRYEVALGASSRDLTARAGVTLPALTLPASWHAPDAFTSLPVMGSAGTTADPETPAG